MNNLKTFPVLAALLLAGCSALDNPYDENNTNYTEYTLTVNNQTDGGSVTLNPSNKAAYKYGESVTATAKAAEGYEFARWSGASTDTNPTVTVRITKNETLTANFRQKQYTLDCAANPDAPECRPAYAVFTITFDANGGTVSPTSGVTVADSTLGSLPFPNKRTGYTFGGWYTADIDGDEVTTETKFSADNIIYAQWVSGIVPTYTIKFDFNDGDVTQDSGTTTASGTLPSLPTPIRNGYTFSGWFTAAADGETVTTSSVFTNDTTIYAQWTLAQYTITFNANEGTVSPMSGKTGMDWKLDSLPTPTKDDYTFNGWFTAETGGTAVDTSTVFSNDVIIYAQWVSDSVPTYTITFDANGGTVSPTSSMTNEEWKLASLPTPKRANYTFNGWFMAETGGTNVDTSEVYSANTTIYAQWTFDSTFVDDRDSTPYKRVQIGTQIWMAENLNYDFPNDTRSDVCYKDDPDYCAKYGRLYTWEVAMKACPTDWHLPSDAEWDMLVNYVGDKSTAGKELKSKSGWNDKNDGSSGNGTDDYGFSALPGGFNPSPGNGPSDWQGIDNRGAWWSASGIHPFMVGESPTVNFESSGTYAKRSVRCVLGN